MVRRVLSLLPREGLGELRGEVEPSLKEEVCYITAK